MYKQKKQKTQSLLATAIVACLALSVPTHSHASESKPKTILVKGKVSDERGKPLMGASVWNQGTYKGASTSGDGSFILTLPSGKSHLRISYVGYKTTNIEFSATRDTTLQLKLEASSIICDEVVISDSRPTATTPTTATTLNKEKLQANNINGALPYIMELEPSIVSTAENGTSVGNTSFRLRGTDATRINVNINGIPLNNPESQGVYWVNIVNLSAMAESVQIQRGAGSANGGASSFGGSISMQTLNPQPEAYATADVSRGSFNTSQTAIMVGSGIMKNETSIEAAYSKLTSDGFLRNGFCDHESIYLSAGKYGERSLLKFITIIGKQHTGITWNGATKDEIATDPTFNNAGAYIDETGNTRYYDNETDNYWQQHFQLYYSLQMNNKWLLNSAINYTHGYGYYENYKDDKKFTAYGLSRPIVITNGDTSIIKLSDFVIQKLMNNHSYTENTSLKYENNKISITIGQMVNYYHGNHFGNVVWCQYPIPTLDENYEWYRNIGTKTDASAFGKMIYTFNRQLWGYADLQYRLINYNMNGTDDDNMPLNYHSSYHFLNPKAGLTYQPNNLSKITFLASIANREPTRADIKDAIKGSGSQAPKPETMLDLELGCSYNPNDWKISANAYFMGYNDQLVASGKLNSVGYALMENVEKSYRIGIEIATGIQMLSWLKAEANITLSQNKIINYIHYEEHYNNPTDWEPMAQKAVNYGNTQLAFSPNIVGAAIMTIQPTQSIKIQLTGKYVGSQYYDNTERQETRLDPYFVINSKISYIRSLQHGKEIEFQFALNNMLNKQYINNAWGYEAHFADGSPKHIEQGFFVQPGINATARMVLKL